MLESQICPPLPLWIWVAGVAVLGIVLAFRGDGNMRLRCHHCSLYNSNGYGHRQTPLLDESEIITTSEDAERRIRDLEDKSKIK
jgi:hypothetical protein